MYLDENIELIRSVVHKNVSNNGNYKLFVIKNKIFDTDSIDIGIDCSFTLNPLKKINIEYEISQNITDKDFFLIDFSYVDSELKQSMYDYYEIIR
jgi:hypothetical protein